MLGEGDQCGQRGDLAHVGVALSVHQLQQLDRELDIAQAAGAELELHVQLVGGDIVGDPLAHPLHRVDEVLPRRARPHLRRHRLHVLPTELEIPSERACLQQRLELPTLGPPLVVRDVRLEGAHERPVLALRSQVRVDLPQAGLGGQIVDAAHRLHRQLRCDRHGPVVREGGLTVEPTRLAHEDDVNV